MTSTMRGQHLTITLFCKYSTYSLLAVSFITRQNPLQFCNCMKLATMFSAWWWIVPAAISDSSTDKYSLSYLLWTKANPGLLAGLGVRLSGVTERRSPEELRLSSEARFVRSWTACLSELLPEPLLSSRWCLLSMELLRSPFSSFTAWTWSKLPLLICEGGGGGMEREMAKGRRREGRGRDKGRKEMKTRK